MKIGFIGTGAITAAVVEGWLKTRTEPIEIWLSPRNADTAARLAALSPETIHIAASNQEVLDRCRIVCLAIRPQIMEDVLRELNFTEHHQVLSFIATVPRARVQDLVDPASHVLRAAPLPTVAQAMGCTVMFPPDAFFSPLFASLGSVMQLDNEPALEAMFAVTAGMGTFFELLETQARWLATRGIDYADARQYLATFYRGLSNAATVSPAPFSELTREYMTRGGLNEQVHAQLSQAGYFADYDEALAAVHKRLMAPYSP
jgi:pyrroline-5-carboxylate reductase